MHSVFSFIGSYDASGSPWPCEVMIRLGTVRVESVICAPHTTRTLPRQDNAKSVLLTSFLPTPWVCGGLHSSYTAAKSPRRSFGGIDYQVLRVGPPTTYLCSCDTRQLPSSVPAISKTLPYTERSGSLHKEVS
jgi:hypothetical protein